MVAGINQQVDLDIIIPGTLTVCDAPPASAMVAGINQQVNLDIIPGTLTLCNAPTTPPPSPNTPRSAKSLPKWNVAAFIDCGCVNFFFASMQNNHKPVRKRSKRSFLA